PEEDSSIERQAPIPQEALRSPDGLQWWDGMTWQSVPPPIPPDAVISPDGKQWWDGTMWRPVRVADSEDTPRHRPPPQRPIEIKPVVRPGPQGDAHRQSAYSPPPP